MRPSAVGAANGVVNARVGGEAAAEEHLGSM
jgi:hypothetical protein